MIRPLPYLTPVAGPLAWAIALGIATVASSRAQDLRPAATAFLEARVPADGDADARVAALLDAVRLDPRHPVAALLIEAIGANLTAVRDPVAAADSLRALLDLDLHGNARITVESSLRSLLRMLGRSDEAAAIDPFAAWASELLAIGPFGDEGDHYSDVPFAPERAFPAPDQSCPGRFGPVRSYVVRRRTEVEHVVLQPRESNRNGCFYGLHQVESAEARPCYLDVVCNGSYELFVNGDPVAAVNRIADRGPDRRFHAIRLRPGVNHTLIKTTLAERSTVALRYVDAIGRPVEIEQLAADSVRGIAPAPPDPPELPAPFVDDALALRRAAARGETIDAVTLASLLLDVDRDEPDPALASLLRLQSSAPEEPRLQLALAVATSRCDELPAEVRDALSRQLTERAAAALPDHLTAVLRTAQTMRADDSLEDAARLLAAQIESGHEARELFEALDVTYRELGHESGSRRVREQWLSVHPADPAPRLSLARERIQHGDLEGALALARAGLERLPGHDGLLALAQQTLAALGRSEEALAALAARALDRGDPAVSARARATLLTQLGSAEAGTVWRAIAARDDLDAAELAAAGRELHRLGDRDAALAAWQASLRIDPAQHDLRRTVQRLTSAEPTDDHPLLARFRASAEDVERMVAAYTQGPRDQGAVSTMLLDRMVVQFYADGSRVEEVHQIRRLNDRAGVDAFQEPAGAASADEIVRLRTIAADGVSYYPKRVENTFSMPRIEPGAFVEELYRDVHPAPGAAPWRGPEFLFQSGDEPFVLSELVLVLPAGDAGTVRVRNYLGRPEEIDLGDGVRALRFSKSDQPRLDVERFSPAAAALAPLVTYGEDHGYGAELRVSRVTMQARTRSSAFVADATARVIDGVAGDAARAASIHAWVHDNIAVERGGNTPTQTLLRRQGPRIFLLAAMLREAGVPFRTAFARPTREEIDGEPPPLFLGDDTYDVAALRIEPSDGQPAWVFADAARYAPLGFVPADRGGAAVLMLDDGTVERLPAGTDRASGWAVAGSFTVAGDGTGTLQAQLTLRDENGYGLADRVREVDANRRGLIARNVATQLFEGWTVADANLVDPTPGRRFAVDLQMTRRDAVQRSGDATLLALPMPASRMFARFGDRPDRRLPYRLTSAGFETWDIDIDPGELRILQVPDDVRIRTALCDYALTFEVRGERLRVRRTLHVRPGEIAPGSFGAWLTMLESIDRVEAQRIVCTKR